MGALLESGLVGNIGLKHLKVIREDTIEKWNKLGFLDGLKGHTRENIAQLYENQATHLINEATQADASGSFETVVFPIIRRVFSKLLANDIVSVQALNLPIGKLFYFVPKISDRRYGGSADPTWGHFEPKGMPGQTNANQQSYDTVNLYDQYYEDGRGLFDISKGKYSGVSRTAQFVTWNTTGGTMVPANIWQTLTGYTSAATYNTYDCLNGGLRSLLVRVGGFNNLGQGKLIGPNGNEMDTEEFLASLKIRAAAAVTCCPTGSTTQVVAAGGYVPFRLVTQKYGKGIVGNIPGQGTSYWPGRDSTYENVCDGEGFLYLELDLSCPACITCESVDGYVGANVSSSLSTTNFTAEYRIYQDLEFEDELGEVSFDLDSVTVSVTERKLRATWSPELAQDVSAFHNIDAEAELTALLSEEVAAEIDREILKDLRAAASWTLRWDYNGWKRFQAGQAPYTQKDWNQTLITAINQISAQIHKSTLRGGANWIVCSSEASAIFDDLEYFHASNAAPDQDQYNMGIEKIGTLSGRYTVYRDPYFPANKVLIGHKGTSLLDTGYIYAPYVPLQLTPTMYNPFNFAPIKGIMTRYAKKVVNNRFYGAITIDGVRTFDIRELR
tara:strand:- start:42921 stop:44759 length:1839 start_codon:yes stop_codon:yes gene_type:complete